MALQHPSDHDADGAATITPNPELMELEDIKPGEHLLRQGDESTFFAMIESGTATVERSADGDVQAIAEVGAGDILGELGLLRNRRRVASVRATSPLRVWKGDVNAFDALLATPGVNERLRSIVTARLAERAEPVAVEKPGKPTIWLRPLLPTDREGLQRATQEASAETLRRRFFTTVTPSARMLDYLVFIDYVDHFAWVAMDEDGEGIGVGRYIRDAERSDRAEFAFTVTDSWQGNGVGTRLLAAVGVAAVAAGIDELLAQFLSDNAASRVLFAKAGATFSREEPGVTDARFDPKAAAALISPGDAERLTASGTDIVQAAGLALASGSGRQR